MGMQAVVFLPRQSSQQPVLAEDVDSPKLSHSAPPRCGRGRGVRCTRTRPLRFSLHYRRRILAVMSETVQTLYVCQQTKG